MHLVYREVTHSWYIYGQIIYIYQGIMYTIEQSTSVVLIAAALGSPNQI